MNAAGALPLAVLISGRGSNMLAIAAACASGRIRARVAIVISDRADALGLEAARGHGLATRVVSPREFADRPAFEQALAAAIEASGARLVVLAGFMKVLSPSFVQRFHGAMLNIHPSLLPRHRGLHTHERVLAAQESTHGASVHFVTPELDAGPLILQAEVPVLPGDTVERLSARVQQQEHTIYPEAIDWIAAGRLTLVDGLPWFDGQPLTRPAIRIAGDTSA
jgi:phosphoribosylglycinamide formyltransferase 1